MEVVGGPGVVVVVDDGGEEEGEDLQVRHPVLQSSLGDAAVRGLQDVAGVQVVVVGGPVTEITRLYLPLKPLLCPTRRIRPPGDRVKCPGWREES